MIYFIGIRKKLLLLKVNEEVTDKMSFEKQDVICLSSLTVLVKNNLHVVSILKVSFTHHKGNNICSVINDIVD